MKATIFKQYEGDWAKLPFPGGGTLVKGSGCGLCAVTHILIEDNRYANYTPSDVQPYMKKWAVRNEGLIHDGIPDSLRHYGMENVKEFGRSATMNDIWAEMNKGNRKAVILTYKCNSRGRTIPATGPDGTCWTAGGHFIAVLDYKIENGKHLLYIKDSGSRQHNEWYAYENSLAGCVWKMWTCTVQSSKQEKKAETKTDTGKVIDVSYVQKNIDWTKVKASGVEGAIIRCGYRGYGSGKLMTDDCFESHIKGATKAGLKVGVYFFTEGISAAEGKAEAVYTLNLIKKAGVKLSYPIAIDTEYINASARANNLSKAARTAVINAFCAEIKAQGYEPMIYASTSWRESQLDMSKLPYKVWVAQYNNKVTYKGNYVMWQYTSTGKVDGISGVVDLNKSYMDTKKAETKKNITINQLDVDGVVGSATIRAAQLIFDTPVDGIISGQAESDMKHCPAISKSCVKIGKGGSQLVRAIQRKVGVKQDGYLGVKTIKAVQKWLNITVDGSWGPHTSRSFQLWLNKQIQPTPKQLTQFQKGVLTFAKEHSGGKRYHYVVFTDDERTHWCPFCYKEEHGVDLPPDFYGGNCIKWSWGCLHHGGGIPCNDNGEVINNQMADNMLDMTNAEMIELVRRRTGVKDWMIIKNSNGIPVSQIQPADVLIYYEGKTSVHQAVAVENGLICDCARGHSPQCKYGVPYNYEKGVLCKIAIRYTGK